MAETGREAFERLAKRLGVQPRTIGELHAKTFWNAGENSRLDAAIAKLRERLVVAKSMAINGAVCGDDPRTIEADIAALEEMKQ